MRFLVFIGLFIVVGMAAAGVPDVPKMPTPVNHWLQPFSQTTCKAPVVPTGLHISSGSGFSLSLAGGPTDRQDRFYKDLSGITIRDDNGKPTVVLERMDRQSMQLEAGAGMHVGIPRAPMNLAFVIRNHTEMATTFPGDTTNKRLWGDGAFTNEFSTADNTMLGSGKVLTEAGLTLDHAFGNGGNPFNFNAAFTARRQDLYQYDMPLEQDYRSLYADQYGLNEEQGFNLDTGISKTIHGFDLAVNVANLFPRGMDRDADIYGLKTTASVATIVHCGFSAAKLNLDWNARDGVDGTPNQRYATARMAFGGAYSDDEQPRVHLGYRHDLEDNLASLTTLGIGFSPLNVLDLDISGTKARSGSYGVMAELGFKLR